MPARKKILNKKKILPNSLFPDIQAGFSDIQVKRQQKLTVFDYFQQPYSGPIKTQRVRPSHIIRTQRPQAFYQPINFLANYKITQSIPTNITAQTELTQSEKVIIDPVEYDKQITRQFEKDFMEYQLHMQKIQVHEQKAKTHRQKTWQKSSIEKFQIEAFQNNFNENRIRYPVTEHTIFLGQKQKTPMRTTSFRNSAVSNRQKHSIKKTKDKILPKQIESEKGSSSQNSSSRQSVFLGRGLDGLTEKRPSFEETQNQTLKKDRLNLQTMITQESHIKNSSTNTATEYSHVLTSPKSQYNIGMAFGGGNKYGAAGMSYQEIGDMKARKIASFSKFYF